MHFPHSLSTKPHSGRPTRSGTHAGILAHTVLWGYGGVGVLYSSSQSSPPEGVSITTDTPGFCGCLSFCGNSERGLQTHDTASGQWRNTDTCAHTSAPSNTEKGGLVRENPLACSQKKRGEFFILKTVGGEGRRGRGHTGLRLMFANSWFLWRPHRLPFSTLLLNPFKETHSVHRDTKVWGQRLRQQASRAGQSTSGSRWGEAQILSRRN